MCLSSVLWKNGGSDLDAVCVVGWMDPGMRKEVGFWDWSTGRGNFGGKYEAPHCHQWGTFYYWEFPYHGAARFLLGKFLELQVRRAAKACRPSAQCGRGLVGRETRPSGHVIVEGS